MAHTHTHTRQCVIRASGVRSTRAGRTRAPLPCSIEMVCEFASRRHRASSLRIWAHMGAFGADVEQARSRSNLVANTHTHVYTCAHVYTRTHAHTFSTRTPLVLHADQFVVGDEPRRRSGCVPCSNSACDSGHRAVSFSSELQLRRQVRAAAGVPIGAHETCCTFNHHAHYGLWCWRSIEHKPRPHRLLCGSLTARHRSLIAARVLRACVRV